MTSSDQKNKRLLAIALEYSEDGGQPPIVAAKGFGKIAEQILSIAFANDIKVRRDEDLAQLLNMVEIDSPIPMEAFGAVAEIFAYIYRMNQNEQYRRFFDDGDEGLSVE